MTKPRVLLLGKIIHAHKGWEQLADVAELSVSEPTSRQQFIDELKTTYNDITAIFGSGAGEGAVGPIDEELASHFPKSLKYICHHGAGYDNIQVAPLTKRGIQLSNTPAAVDEATADTGFYLLLGALRNFNKAAMEVRRGNWIKNVPQAHDPEGKVLGILGMGGIGRALRDKAKPFKFSKILYYNRNRLSPELEGGAEYVASQEELAAKSDVLYVSVPLNKATHHLIDAKFLSQCKDGIVIVNTARGAVIDEQALVDALESGKVSTAGLDVFEFEPKIHPKLLENENIMLLPHMGTHTVETRLEMETTVLRNIRAGLTEGKVIDLVPEQVGKL
jgi:glyoxylate reductase